MPIPRPTAHRMWRRSPILGVMLGLGGALRLSEQATLEIAVTEDDGLHRGAPDIGLHAAIRWRP